MKPYASDRTFLPDRNLQQMLHDLPTPFFLYDEQGIKDAALQLREAFCWNDGFMQHFPVRTNPNPTVLQLMREAGCGVFCDNAAELTLAKRCGFSHEQILCSAFGAAEGHRCILDGAHELPPQPPQQALLRYNPGGRLAFEGSVLAALDRIRLGMPQQTLVCLANHLRQFGTQSLGVSFRAQSGDPRPEYLPAVAKLLFALACTLQEQTGLQADVCCLGDGLGASFRPEISAPSFSDCGTRIRALYDEILCPAGLDHIQLKLTLGRRMIAPHGIFITRVQAVKDGRKPLIITDAADCQFPAALLPGSYHHVHVLGAGQAAEHTVCNITGCQTSPQTCFAENRVLAKVRAGDVLVFHTAGAVRPTSFPAPGYAPCPEYLLCADGSVLDISEEA